MLRSIVFVFGFFCFFLQSQEKLDSLISFIAENPKLGAKKNEVRFWASSMTMEIKIDDQIFQTMDIKKSQSQKRESWILSLQDNIVTKVKVHYLESTLKKQTPKGEEVETEPVHGKIYIVEKKGKELLCSNLEEKTPAGSEIQYLQKDFQNLGKPEPMASFFHGKKLKIGQKVEIPSAMALEIFGSQENLIVEEFSFTLQEVKQSQGMSCAIFQTVVKTSRKSAEEICLSTELKGETILGLANCWLVSMNLQGTSQVQGTKKIGEKTMEMKGRGILEMSISIMYQP